MLADKPARERALDTSTSFIVQAPAGSGKTELLIQRYLKVLQTVETPGAVVAVTFTRKAAGEMRARVLESLQLASEQAAPNSEHERLTGEIARQTLEHDCRLGWNLLKNPSQLQIETIDALCASITRRMPWVARFGVMPEVCERADELYREAAQNTLRHVARDNTALSFLLLHLDNDFMAAERLIVQMLEKRDQWLRHTGVNPDLSAVRAELEASLQRLNLSAMDAVRLAFDQASAAEVVAVLGLDRFPEPSLPDLPQWNTMADLLLTSSGAWRKRVDRSIGFPPTHPLKPRLERLLARLEGNQALLEAFQRFRELPAPRFTDSQWQAMESAVSVLALAVAELQLVFRERGRVDFTELSMRASEALGRLEAPSDLALAFGHRIQHILVDEFQDTSYTQFELLEKLTAGWEPGDGRTLFLVGDPMQSIYRFRQADVSLFLKVRSEGIGSIRLAPLSLSVNFRSQPEIVQWVNRTFAKILPQKEDIDSGAVSFSASDAGTVPGEAMIDVQASLDVQDEAARVLDLVKNSAHQKVAVLVRARSHLAALVPLLKRNRIPFQAIEIDQLGERPVIEDLMALTLALLHPADRVSWLAILRAPWCGLTLEDLHGLAAGDRHATIWELLHREPWQVSEDGARRIGRILPVLENALSQRGRIVLRDWVNGVWLRLGGPACEDETALEDAAAYFDLLEGFEEGADLADFNWFREQVNELFAKPDAKAGDALQLMTIHKAKGLEFDCVILPGLGAPPRLDELRLLLWLEQQGELLLAPISETGQQADPIYRYLARLDRRKNDLETGRLLYVAATRARRRLHLLGVVKKKENGSIAEPSAGSFLQLLWPVVSEVFEQAAAAPSPNVAEPVRKIRRVAANWTTPEPPPEVAWVRGPIHSMEPAGVTFEWVGDRLRHTGAALHALLQRIAQEGLEAWDESAVRARGPIYGSLLSNLGVAPADLSAAVRQIELALLMTLRDPRGRWILEAHDEAECELPITGLIDGKLYNTVIDRTFVDESGVRWIIDYKTSVHEGSGLETFLESEQRRYREQLEHYARLMAQRQDRPIRLGLYFPLLGEWREWAAPVVLRKQASLFEL